MRCLPRLCLLVLSLTATLLLPASAHARTDVVFGIEQFGNMENPRYTGLFQDTMVRDGARVMRYIVRWDWVTRPCDPRTRGNTADHTNACYDWSYLDHVVSNADRRGLKVLYSIYGTPKWLFNNGENYTGTSEQDYATFVALYADFAQAAATRYDGRHGQPRVEQWTVWNEPNGSFFQPRMVNGDMVGPARYARLYDAAARRIKAVDPSLRVAVGPTAPFVRALPPATFAAGVLPLLQAWGTPLDAYAHNAYTGAQSPLRNSIRSPYIGLGNVGDLTRIMDRYPVSRNKPVWITEFGYQTGGTQKAIEPEQQPALMADALFFAWSQPRIETFIWYGLHDDDPTGNDLAFMSGLYDNVKTMCGAQLCPKPGAAMFRHTIWASARNASGVVTLWGQGRMKPADTKIYVQRPGQGWHAYFNTDTARSGTVGLRMRLPAGTVVMTCDIYCGPRTTIANGNGTVTGGGGTARVRIQRLRSVRLSRRASLRSGIVYNVNCQCRVTARILARGRISGIRAATRRTVVVGSGRVRSVRGGRRVHMIFTRAAKRELSRKRTFVVTLRTYVRYSNGRRVVTDRPVRLR